jgi:hypothetical protein
LKIKLRSIFSVAIFAAAPFPISISFGGLNGAYLYELIVIACLFFLIFNGALIREIRTTIPGAGVSSIFGMWGVFIIFSLISASLSFFESAFSNHGHELTQLKMIAHLTITLLLLAGALMCGFTLFNGAKDLKYISYLVTIAIFIMSLSVIYEWIMVTGMTFSRYNFEPPTGLGNGDTGKMMIFGALISCSLLFIEKNPINRMVINLVLVTLVIGCLTIQSRAIYIMLLYMSLTMAFMSLQNINVKWRRFAKLGLLIVISVLLLLSGGFILNSFIMTSAFSMIVDSENIEQLNKLAVILEAMKMFSENIFFGIGMGMFGLYTKTEMIFSMGLIGKTVASPHNFIAQLLAEGGIIGFSIFSVLLFRVFKSMHKIFKLKFSGEVYFHIRVLLLFFYSVLVLSIFFSSHFLPPLTQRSSMRLAFYLWFFIGFSLSFFKKKPDYK